MAWTMGDAARWVAEHGGINTDGGLSEGLDALEAALAEGRFGSERERVAREFLRITRAQLDTMAQLRREIDESDAIIREARRHMEEKEARRIELTLNLLSARASQSQADSAHKALRVSWLALFVSLAAVALTAYDLATRAT